jgi:hypothetical protein
MNLWCYTVVIIGLTYICSPPLIAALPGIILVRITSLQLA